MLLGQPLFFYFFLRNNKRHSPKVFFNYYDFISNPRQLAFCFLRLFFGKTVLLFSILVLGADGIWNLFYCLLMIMVRGLRLYSHVHGCGRKKFSTRQIYRHTHTHTLEWTYWEIRSIHLDFIFFYLPPADFSLFQRCLFSVIFRVLVLR